jgi:hypothetical protein
MSRSLFILLVLGILFGCENRLEKAQKLYDEGKYEEVVNQYSDIFFVAEQARRKLEEQRVTDSLATMKARNAPLMRSFEVDFQQYLTFLRSVIDQLSGRNERIASIPLTELYQNSFTEAFHNEAENYSVRKRHELDSLRLKLKGLSPPWYRGSKDKMLGVIDRLAVVEAGIYITYGYFNPTALQNFGFDYLAANAMSGMASNRRELSGVLWELDQTEVLFRDEEKYKPY